MYFFLLKEKKLIAMNRSTTFTSSNAQILTEVNQESVFFGGDEAVLAK